MAHGQISLLKTIMAAFYISQYKPILAITNFMHMTSHCDMSVQVEHSLLLDLTPPENFHMDRNTDYVQCDLDILAPEGTKLFAHFLQMGISPVPEHSDRLHLYDLYPNKTRITPIKGLYGRLDRALSVYDDSGRKIKDYRTFSNKLKVDYIGKSSKKFPGFRLIVTPFQDPTSKGECPPRHYHCKQASICIQRQLACDGYPNCGKGDDGDERGCDRYDTVTNLLAEYSLTRDIIVVILLPLVVFLAAVVLIFLASGRYIRTQIIKPGLPTVQFTSKNGERARISEDNELYEPPTYDDIMEQRVGLEPPPQYNRLVSSITKGTVEYLQSEFVTANSCIAEETELEQETTLMSDQVLNIATISEENEHCQDCNHESYKVHCLQHPDTEADEDMTAQNRQKQGMGKVKEFCAVVEDDSSNNHLQSSFLQGKFSPREDTSSCMFGCVHVSEDTSSCMFGCVHVSDYSNSVANNSSRTFSPI